MMRHCCHFITYYGMLQAYFFAAKAYWPASALRKPGRFGRFSGRDDDARKNGHAALDDDFSINTQVSMICFNSKRFRCASFPHYFSSRRLYCRPRSSSRLDYSAMIFRCFTPLSPTLQLDAFAMTLRQAGDRFMAGENARHSAANNEQQSFARQARFSMGCGSISLDFGHFRQMPVILRRLCHTGT